MSIFNPADIGYAARRQVERLGTGARLFARLITSFSSWARFGLIRDQVFFLGNYSLSIIAVSGLFVGFVLGLQGYYTLKSFGSAESVGLLVALSLLRELGPVVTGLLFAGRAGTSLTAEIGLMKAGEQLAAMEMMAVDPVQRILAPRFWGGVIAMPVLGVLALAWSGKPVPFFGASWTLPLTVDVPLGRSLKDIHEAGANLVFAAVGLHAAAALWHQFVLKDGLLRRMK